MCGELNGAYSFCAGSSFVIIGLCYCQQQRPNVTDWTRWSLGIAGPINKIGEAAITEPCREKRDTRPIKIGANRKYETRTLLKKLAATLWLLNPLGLVPFKLIRCRFPHFPTSAADLAAKPLTARRIKVTETWSASFTIRFPNIIHTNLHIDILILQYLKKFRLP